MANSSLSKDLQSRERAYLNWKQQKSNNSCYCGFDPDGGLDRGKAHMISFDGDAVGKIQALDKLTELITSINLPHLQDCKLEFNNRFKSREYTAGS